ncbi:MAG TPA: PDDEXK nuclease domain-containing protein [Verrucomicrobiota bacterium]|nr:PDDEXK nuclease domain-containing protein [Verrucomicrobiota bacterium]
MPRFTNNKTLTKGRPASGKIVATSSRQLAKASPKALLADVRELILAAREGVAQAVNASLVTLYWQIGKRIHKDVLQEKRAEYGQKIVAALGRQLETEFGRGFTEKNLWRMVQFTEAFPNEQIVAALRRQLGWTHFRQLIPIEDPLKRDFYAEMCRIENWSTRTLAKKISGLLFERTAISKKTDKLIRQELKTLREEDKLTPDLVFRDPYVLDFLKLKDTYSESDIEAAILREIESFILELGAGFCFVTRQKRMQIDSRDYYLDLLFYHRKLRRLVAMDLKLDEFDAADKGQMELYLNWLKKHEQGADEAPPLGIILCAGKRQEHVELLAMDRDGIHVASYVTKEIPKKQLERKLHEAVRLARARLERGKL